MNKLLDELNKIKYYIAFLGVLLLLLNVYYYTGGKVTGSTSSEKWNPEGSGNHNLHRGTNSFYHK